MLHTRKCGEISEEDFGSEQTLCGWLQDTRNLGGIAFLQLRDITGVIQLTLLKKKLGDNFKEWASINRESVVQVTGVVKENKEAPGGVEMLPENLEILNEAEAPLPLGVIDKIESEIETRLNARYLDLRKKEIAANFQIRAAVSGAVHEHLRKEKFLEVQTPKIIASATEGGTSLFEMKYFDKTAYLAQSPQLYKQMLMGGGLERVYEVGPAFRAEEHNTPRHLNEFISIDIEMSFVTQEDVFSAIEPVLHGIFEEFGGDKNVTPLPFPRIPFAESMLKYGNDKPDLRNPIVMSKVTEVWEGTDFKIFASAIEKGSVVRAIPAPGAAEMPRSFFDNICSFLTCNTATYCDSKIRINFF